MLRVAIAAALAASAVSGAIVTGETETRFEMWMSEHGKTYATDAERAQRLQTFADNLERIDNLNARDHGKTKYGMNKFGDLSTEEFRTQWASGMKQVDMAKMEREWPVAPEFSAAELKDTPTSFDWRTKGAVTPVKNQGQCGSCWSFSTTGNIEGQWFLSNHSLVGLSEQNLIDCSVSEGNMGCNGGLMSDAFEYVIKNKGIDSEQSYPYTATGPNQCQFNRANVAATIDSYTMLPKDEAQIATYLYKNGPVSIAADAASWQFYIDGVIYWPCGTSLDHGILLVGMGVETDIFDQRMPYWIVKNSWGADWGKDGYLWLEYAPKGDECGMNQFACSSVINK